MIDRTVVQSMIQAALDESWRQWYDCTRLAAADLLEECDQAASAAMVREGRVEPSCVEIDGSGEMLSIWSISLHCEGGTQAVSLRRGDREDASVIWHQIVRAFETREYWLPSDLPIRGKRFVLSLENDDGGSVSGRLRILSPSCRLEKTRESSARR